jgi:hypothetical protein
MKQTLIATMLVALTASFTHADDITTTDGKVYKNATILSHTVTSAMIESDNGGAIVPLANLPADLQKKLGYDPAAAKDAIAKHQAMVDASTSDMMKQATKAETARDNVAVNGILFPIKGVKPYKLSGKLSQSCPVTLSDGRSLGNGCLVQLWTTDYVEVQRGGNLGPVATPMGLKETNSFALLTWPLTQAGVQTVDVILIGVSDQGYQIYAPAPKVQPD